MTKRVLIIGAGPTGIAAALGAQRRGHDVTVVERDEVGAALRRWGATKFFTPVAMNLSRDMREALGDQLPADDALLTGPEMVDQVLLPIASSSRLSGRIHVGHRVVAVGRRGMSRADYAGHPLRAERPFRIMTQTSDGDDAIFEADVVIDATGGFNQPLPIGTGGLPAKGERKLNGEVARFLSDVDERVAGRRLLLIGHGHSAANALGFIEKIVEREPTTKLTWAVRTPNRRPCVEIADDPLPERKAIVARANELAEKPPPWLSVLRRVTVDAIVKDGEQLHVTFSNSQLQSFDRLLGFTGYRPDCSYLTELAVDLSPVTEGGAKLYRAISNVTDCLSVPKVAATDLESGEPNFYFAGSRSYGRARTFLLQTGYVQLETLLDRIGS